MISRRRRVVFPFHYRPDKKLVHIVAELADEPGALASLLTLVGSRVNLEGTTSYNVGDGTSIFSGFGEIVSSSETASSIQSLAALSRKVRRCQVWESEEGLLVDTFHTGLQTGLGEPYIMLPASGLAHTFEKIVHRFGTGGETILFMEGKEFAEARFSIYRPMLGARPERRIKEATHIFEALGYGSSSVSTSQSKDSLTLTVEECFECTKGSTNGRTCAFMRGVAVGSFSALFRQEMTAKEVKCRLKGGKACVFVLTPADGHALQ